jgi:lipopolysaccharide transport system ATP-binding protein
LKLLSRVTAPTTGNIKVKGRIASLLEVGTGFHPELTGRENIYLNGAILGMRKKEITRKFDEIVDFSGVERYIDTPVKRYSSGMYVRLAFAVAAHLESEILIVDEVLAVGDAEFQKKCLGKMGEVSKGEGRTVLFVSHNLQSINSLCTFSVLLNNGNIDYYDQSALVINKYRTQFNKPTKITINNSINESFRLEDIYYSNEKKDTNITIKDGIYFELKFDFKIKITGLAIEMNVTNDMGILIFSSVSDTFTALKGTNIFSCQVPKSILNNIIYNFSFRISKNQIAFLAKYENIISIDVSHNLDSPNGNNNIEGLIRPNIIWKLNQK